MLCASRRTGWTLLADTHAALAGLVPPKSNELLLDLLCVTLHVLSRLSSFSWHVGLTELFDVPIQSYDGFAVRDVLDVPSLALEVSS